MKAVDIDYFIKNVVACPKCYSEDIRTLTGKKEIYRCQKCKWQFSRRDHIRKLEKLKKRINAKNRSESKSKRTK